MRSRAMLMRCMVSTSPPRLGGGALGGFSVGLAGFLECRAPFCVDGGEVLLYRWGSAPIEWLAIAEALLMYLVCIHARRLPPDAP